MLCQDTPLYPMSFFTLKTLCLYICFIPVISLPLLLHSPRFKVKAREFQGQRKIKKEGGKKRFKHEKQCNVNAWKCKAISSSIYCISL